MSRRDRQSVIMVVEDEPKVAEVAVIVIQSLGYVVFWCNSAKTAFKRIGHCDLVFTDLSMPEDSGLDLIKWIRAAGNDIPIVATTGNTGVLEVTLEHGASATIPKPWVRDDLQRTLAELLG